MPRPDVTAPATSKDTIGWVAAVRTRVGVLIGLMLFWTIWFAVTRALFIAWFRELIPGDSRSLVWRSFLHGARMDLSAAAYLTVVPWLIVLITIAARPALTRRLLGAYGAVVVVFIALVTMTDIGTFGPWRRRLDASLWTYLASPNEAYASASSIAVVPLFGALGLLLATMWWTYARLARRPERQMMRVGGRPALTAAGVLLIVGTTLAIPIRGGVQWTPINESTVFFSRSEFVNMAALNPGWNLLSTTVAVRDAPTRNPYATMSPEEMARIVDSLFPAGRAVPPSILRIAKPNVILIIWESFTAKVVERLGGRAAVTPQFERWAHRGILFDSLFASGERSAQGLVSILSGFPSIPNATIMTRPTKAAGLPQLGASLQRAGYHTAYLYGGELEFANMKAYVLGGGFDRVTGLEAFAAGERNSKWGAHDHVVLARALNDMQRSPRPFFSTVFTLSSHEPFEVPAAPVFEGDDESTRFLNAHHYADASIGHFLDSASVAPWWDSTLVVIIADHGSPLPRPAAGASETVPERHHIPMLWLGGALRVRDTVVHRIGSSVDLAPTLLAQLGVSSTGFRWGHDLLATNADAFAYFEYHDGFTFMDRTGWLVYDARARSILEHGGAGGAQHRRAGSALLQATFADYMSR